MDQIENLLGAVAIAVSDAILVAISAVSAVADEDVAVVVMLGAQPMSVVAIAAATARSHSATVRSIDRLARVGVVERHRDSNDGRVVEVVLTPDGDGARTVILQAREKALSRMLRTLSSNEQIVMTQLLRTMLTGIVETPAATFRICRLCDESSCVPRGCPVEERHEQLTT